MSGTADVVKAGARFGSLMHSPAMDERSADTMRIASSFLLGPLLLAEFVKSVYRLERTSLAPTGGGGAGQQSPGTMPFAQLCMRAFAACVRGIMTDGPHGMSKAKRVQTLISCAVGKARSVAPQSGDGFDYFNGRTPARPHGAPEDEMQLARALVPFVSPGVVSEATTCDDASTRLSVLAELLANGMKTAAQVLKADQEGALDGHGHGRGRKSGPGGSGSPRAPRTPKVKVEQGTTAAASMFARAGPMGSAGFPSIKDESDEIDEVEAEEFRKRMKVVLT